ncbi:hypothetical protein AAE478_005350 [Parahypoxylon ruwenzoriense]
MPGQITPEAIPTKQPVLADDRSRPVPTVPIFDSATATVDEVIDRLIRAGGCVVRGAVAPEVLAQIEQDTRRYILADGEWAGDFFPKETRRVCGLAGKSKAFTEGIVGHDLFKQVGDRMLASKISCWIGDKWEEHLSPAQVNNTIIFSIGPGARAQALHRDDMIHHNMPRSKRVEDYEIGQDTGVGFFVAAKKSTRANGATRFIPGSHLWAHATPPDESLAVHAELEPGDGFIFLSSCYHGGSANTTTDEERLLYSFFMTKGYLRQEENQYLASSYDTVANMYDDDMLQRLGYSVSAPFLGWVDLKHPLDAIRGESKLRDLY